MGQVGRVVLVVLFAFSLTSSLRAALVTNLGVLGDDTHSGATDVNESGVVVGASFYFPPTSGQPPPVYQSFRWTTGSGLQPLVPPGTTPSLAQGVNAHGAIVGWFGGGAGMYYPPPGPAQTIANAGEASAINDNGVIVGYVPQAGVTQHAYRYDGTAPPQDLSVIGGTQSYAHDINNAGTVVGWSNISSSSTVKKAFRYVGATGPMQAIPGLSNFADSEARAINEAGDIVGFVDGGGAFRFTAAGTLVALPGTSARALDINDAGFVVGTYGVSPQLAALWRPNNTFVDLDQWLNANDPIQGPRWTLTNGLGINNNGLIVGVGQYNDGAGGLTDGQRAYVLDASALVPEPGAMSLLVPLAALLARRGRRGAVGRADQTTATPGGRLGACELSAPLFLSTSWPAAPSSPPIPSPRTCGRPSRSRPRSSGSRSTCPKGLRCSLLPVIPISPSR